MTQTLPIPSGVGAAAPPANSSAAPPAAAVLPTGRPPALERATRYAFAIGPVALAHVIGTAAWHSLGPMTYTVFLSAVMIASLYGGYGPGLLATTLASVDIAFSFISPYNSLVIHLEELGYVVTFTAVALLTSSLQARRRSAEAGLRRAHAEMEARVRDRTAELAASQEQLGLLINGVADQAFFTLDRHGRVASWNGGAERLLGYHAAAIVGRPVATVWPLVRERRFAGGRHERHDDQTWAARADGTWFWAGLALTPIHDEAGRPRGSALSLRDLSERRDLERDLLDIAEREQQRIGHDLHDGLGQELTGISMLSVALAEQLRGGPAGVAGHAEQVAGLIQRAIRHTRDLARGLCPVDLEDEGLASALARLADRVSRLPGVTCRFDGDPDDAGRADADAATRVHLYRVAQEAINNALRHGRARTLTVSLRATHGRLTLAVSDDGVGFSPDDAPAGMGLRLMHYRARMIRATLDIRTNPAGGTSVACEIAHAPGGGTAATETPGGRP